MLRGHAGLRRHGILIANALLLLHVLLVGHLPLLLGRHVGRRQVPHAGRRLLRRDLGVVDVFGGVDGRFAVDAVLVAGCRLGRVQACLRVGVIQLEFVRRRECGGCGLVTNLDQVLAFGFGYKWLQFGRGERVYEARLGHHEKEHLGAREDGQLVGLEESTTDPPCLACALLYRAERYHADAMEGRKLLQFERSLMRKFDEALKRVANSPSS